MLRTSSCPTFLLCPDVDTLQTTLIVALVFVFSGLLVWIVRTPSGSDRRVAMIVTVALGALIWFWMWSGLAG